MQIFVKTLTGKTTSLWPNDCLSNKSPPRTTSSAPTRAWTQTHGSGEATNACGEANLHVIRGVAAGGHADDLPRQEP
jgi:hypothetical protein